jgi:glucose/arabinose dehydrogenase
MPAIARRGAAGCGTSVASASSDPMSRRAIVLVAALGCAPVAWAQPRLVTYATGFSAPVAIVQDPTDPKIQFVVQQAGRIRVVRDGVVQGTDFLTLTGAIRSGGEQGLLGLAFAPDYAVSRRFYVNFTDPNGRTVVARFKRSLGNPLVAELSSRFDLRWSTGLRYIHQDFTNHNGGCLAFGADGYLYVGMGDGGSGNDPNNRAQSPTSLLGKMLRIDVSVPDADPNGFRVPPDNPFLSGPHPEIWSYGWRNPWRFSFDDPARGGDGALVAADVGQGAWEEINYEPAGRGGRNYGWRIREGAHPNPTESAADTPPAFLPLVDPIHEYDHNSGRSITGGYVYRGSIAAWRGRYFFADYVTRRVWSLLIQVDSSSGAVQAVDLQDHTAALAASNPLGSISAFGVDAQGELFVVDHTGGRVYRLTRTIPRPANVRIVR